MGRKRTRAGEFFYFFAACLIFPYLMGCAVEMRKAASQKELVTSDLQEEQNSEPTPWEALQQARILFLQGNLEASLEENQKVLKWAGNASPADKALFNMGVIYAHGTNPKRDPEIAMAYFRNILEEFPESPLTEESKVWIALLQKNVDLTKDLVDLTHENVALLQENTKLSDTIGKTKEQENTTQTVRDHFQRAKRFFDQGNYEASLEENQRILSFSGKNIPKDRALFQMGLIWAQAGNPKRDMEKSLSFFQRLLREYPQSPWNGEAKTWVAVIQENIKLSQMIEKSKEVDIAIEEKKREKGK
jgi:tetratricopeptide (TPR) repeat protein